MKWEIRSTATSLWLVAFLAGTGVCLGFVQYLSSSPDVSFGSERLHTIIGILAAIDLTIVIGAVMLARQLKQQAERLGDDA